LNQSVYLELNHEHAENLQVVPAGHATPHAPQLFELVTVLVSHPFAGIPSQLAKPELQVATVHALFTQPATPFAIEQVCPQLPQLLTSAAVLVSHPFAGNLSQSL